MLTPRESAAVLAALYEEAFSDQQSGSYRISRDDMRAVTGRPVFHQTIIEDVADWLIERGLIMIDRDSFYVIMRYDAFDDIRLAPAAVLEKYRRSINYGGPYAN